MLDRQKFNLIVVAETAVQETWMGLQWLKMLRLVADFIAGVVTLG
ncbi:MAG: hypothetical protein AB1861_19015 [Cyanobacteriota bacterium]